MTAAGLPGPPLLLDQLGHLGVLAHGLEEKNVARVEDHAVRRVPFLLAESTRRAVWPTVPWNPVGSARDVAHVLRLLGDIAGHPDRFDAESGEAHYREALALAEPRGRCPLVARCRRGLGETYASVVNITPVLSFDRSRPGPWHRALKSPPAGRCSDNAACGAAHVWAKYAKPAYPASKV
jgi:hypothetical protein